MRALAGRCWPAVMLAEVTGSRSVRTSDAQTPLTARSLSSPSPTLIRPSATTRPLPTRRAPESSRPLRAEAVAQRSSSWRGWRCRWLGRCGVSARDGGVAVWGLVSGSCGRELVAVDLAEVLGHHQ